MNARPSTHQKALQINLDGPRYGTLAEIGAGQEVARWFFHVGRAAGTVAKTISAYDMGVSDAIYGRSDRYVSRKRLESMLTYELELLRERLDAMRGESTTFFAFADTVATRGGSGQTGNGWMGVRFQAEPRGEPSEIIISVAMRDNETVRQQEALGIVGVNLIYGAFNLAADPSTLVASLMDDLAVGRIEIDMVKFSGPLFTDVDHRLMSLQLVEQGFTDAAMFTAAGEVVQPSEALYKKSILVERGRFRPLTHLNLDLLEGAHQELLKLPEVDEPPLVLMEMTLQDLKAQSGIDEQDFLARADILHTLGKTVLISNYHRYFRLVEYLCRHTQKPIGIALGMPGLVNLADERHYPDLAGGWLESAGRMFPRNVKVYVYPQLDESSGRIISVDQLEVAPRIRHLFAHLLENQLLVPIRNYNPGYLAIHSAEVLADIQAGNPRWEAHVPVAIVEVIKRGQLFGCRP